MYRAEARRNHPRLAFLLLLNYRTSPSISNAAAASSPPYRLIGVRADAGGEGLGSEAASGNGEAATGEGEDGGECEEAVVPFLLPFLPPLPFTLSLSLGGVLSWTLGKIL